MLNADHREPTKTVETLPLTRPADPILLSTPTATATVTLVSPDTVRVNSVSNDGTERFGGYYSTDPNFKGDGNSIGTPGVGPW